MMLWLRLPTGQVKPAPRSRALLLIINNGSTTVVAVLRWPVCLNSIFFLIPRVTHPWSLFFFFYFCFCLSRCFSFLFFKMICVFDYQRVSCVRFLECPLFILRRYTEGVLESGPAATARTGKKICMELCTTSHGVCYVEHPLCLYCTVLLSALAIGVSWVCCWNGRRVQHVWGFAALCFSVWWPWLNITWIFVTSTSTLIMWYQYCCSSFVPAACAQRNTLEDFGWWPCVGWFYRDLQ